MLIHDIKESIILGWPAMSSVLHICKDNLLHHSAADVEMLLLHKYSVLSTLLTVLSWHHERSPNIQTIPQLHTLKSTSVVLQNAAILTIHMSAAELPLTV